MADVSFDIPALQASTMATGTEGHTHTPSIGPGGGGVVVEERTFSNL